MTRVALALVLSPILLLALLVISVRVLEASPELFSYDSLAGVGSFFIFSTYFFMGCFAVPLAVVLLWRRWLSWWHLAATGAAIGVLAYSMMVWPTLRDDKLHAHFRLAKFSEGYPFALLGAAGGTMFWLLGVFRNPVFRPAASRPRAERSAA